MFCTTNTITAGFWAVLWIKTSREKPAKRVDNQVFIGVRKSRRARQNSFSPRPCEQHGWHKQKVPKHKYEKRPAEHSS
eukprot:2679901-Amphidinium_carterae.1